MTLLQQPSWHAAKRAELKSYKWPMILEYPQLVVSVWEKGHLVAIW